MFQDVWNMGQHTGSRACQRCTITRGAVYSLARQHAAFHELPDVKRPRDARAELHACGRGRLPHSLRHNLGC